jgi:hypothetical protein
MWEQTKLIFLESLERTAAALARLAPGIIGLLLVVALALVGAAVLRAALRRVCERLDLDARARQWGLVRPNARGAPPSLLIERLGGWTVLALGAVLGLQVFDAAAATMLSNQLLGYVPHVVVAVVIAGAGVAAARALERQVLIGAVNMGIHGARFLAVGVRWLVLVVAAAMAFQHLGIGGLVVPVFLGILFGGIVLALALAVGLGARDMVAHSLERRFGPPGSGAGAPTPAPGDVPGAEPPHEDRVQHL